MIYREHNLDETSAQFDRLASDPLAIDRARLSPAALRASERLPVRRWIVAFLDGVLTAVALIFVVAAGITIAFDIDRARHPEMYQGAE